MSNISDFRKYRNIETGRIVEAKIEGDCVYQKLTLEQVAREIEDYSERKNLLSNTLILKKFIADPNIIILRAILDEKFYECYELLEKH